MRSWVQVLTTPTADTPGTILLLHFDGKRYIIGQLGEGTQRACTAMGARLARASELFITGRTRWENTGGLMGLVLTVADVTDAANSTALEEARKKANKKKNETGVVETVSEEDFKTQLTIFGAPNLTHTLATARRYILRKNIPVVLNEVKSDTVQIGEDYKHPATWEDENVKVWAIPVLPSDHQRPSQANTRKRSHDDFREMKTEDGARNIAHIDSTSPNATGLSNAKGGSAEQSDTSLISEKEADDIRRSIVHEMFNSTWRLDRLYEQPLSQVRMPAAIFVRNHETNAIESYTGPLPGSGLQYEDIAVLTRNPWPGAQVSTLPPTQPSQEAISYIFKTHPQRGKFDPAAAKALGIKPGPQFAKLASGQPVQNNEGETIYPEQVLGETKRGRGVAVVDLPSRDYVEGLVNSKEWESEEVMDGLQSVVWILGPGISSDARLKTFMESRSSISHIISSPDHCVNRVTHEEVAVATMALSQIDPKRFRVPTYDNVTVPQRQNLISEHPIPELPTCAIPAQRGRVYDLMPEAKLRTNEVADCLEARIVLKDRDILQLAREAAMDVGRNREKLDAWGSSIPCRDAEITALGTGSSLPSKYRNVSGTLLRIPGHGSYLFDCGEGTLGQLQRSFSQAEYLEILRDLKMIWISHLHADHHLGTISVIKAWRDLHYGKELTSASPTPEDLLSDSAIPRLAVVSHTDYLHFLSEYSSVEDYGYDTILPLRLLSRSALLWSGASDSPFKALSHRQCCTLLGIANIESVNVSHCRGAMAVSVTFPQDLSPDVPRPFKVSYSGDCRPSYEQFVAIGKNSTVLIHEATFDDELRSDAIAKKHSTTSEALAIGAKMGARAVVLTHFSQRYQKIPILENTNGEGVDNLDVVDSHAATEKVMEVDEGANGAEDVADDVPVTETLAPNVAAWKPSPAPQQREAPDEVGNKAVVKVRAGRDMKIAVAFDYMRVKVGEIAELEKYAPVLARLYEEKEKGGGGGGSGGVGGANDPTDSLGSDGIADGQRTQRKRSGSGSSSKGKRRN